jgi:hypothetical protein
MSGNIVAQTLAFPNGQIHLDVGEYAFQSCADLVEDDSSTQSGNNSLRKYPGSPATIHPRFRGTIGFRSGMRVSLVHPRFRGTSHDSVIVKARQQSIPAIGEHIVLSLGVSVPNDSSPVSGTLCWA